jgi:hypothetical protein
MKLPVVMAAIVFVLAPAFAASGSDRTDIFLTIEEAPQAVFPEADSFERRDVPSDAAFRRKLQQLVGTASPSMLEPFYITFEARKEGRVIGYAVICEEIGKHRPITFIVGTGLDGSVRDVAIMMYREAIGGEVRYPGFLKQFHEKRLEDAITHRRDIKNVTGATLSARSMSRGVRKALAVLQLAYEDSANSVRASQ